MTYLTECTVKERWAHWNKQNPWHYYYNSMKSRCHPNRSYGKRGIKALLTKEDVKFLYERDGAKNMNVPSIDRIDCTGDYTLENCRFMELEENKRRKERFAGWIKYKKCLGCGTTEREHIAKGMCKKCSNKHYKKINYVPKLHVHPNKLTRDQVFEIRKKYLPGEYSSTKLGKEYNVSHTSILKIVKRKLWKYI